MIKTKTNEMKNLKTTTTTEIITIESTPTKKGYDYKVIRTTGKGYVIFSKQKQTK